LKVIWQRIPNFKDFIFRTSMLSFVAASPQPLEERVKPMTFSITLEQ